MKFNEFKLDENVLKALEDLHYEEPTPIQEQSIAFLLDGFDVMGEAPTGTGKTLAYALPMISNIDIENDNLQALILCPTRELAIQSAEEIRKVLTHSESIGVLSIYGGQNIRTQILQLKKRPKIVVGTPGRILDHIDRHTLKLGNIRMFVLDECDEMLDMGFAPSVSKIESEIKCDHQSVLFSATISEAIAKLADVYLKKDAKTIKTHQRENESKLISQYYIDVKEDDKLDALRMMLDTFTYDSVFVFCRTKRNVDKLQKTLSKLNYKVSYLHGDLPQKKRDDNMKAFKSRENKILIATDVAARGIDVSGVDFVVNYSLPDQDEFYLHRIGRTGRANTEGKAFTFINKHQKGMLKVYEALTNDVVKEYCLLSAKEKEKMDIKKILENVKNTIKEGNLAEFETQIDETIYEWKKEDVTCSATELAAALLKEALKAKEVTVSEDSEKPSRSNDRGEFKRKERVQFASNPNAQRFFINIGAVDGLDEKGLMHFITKYAETIKESDFSDVYIKGTFSFFELPKEDADLIMEKINGSTFASRDVRVELSERKPESSDRQSRPSRGGYNSSRGGSRGGYAGNRDGGSRGYSSSNRDGGSRGGYAGSAPRGRSYGNGDNHGFAGGRDGGSRGYSSSNRDGGSRAPSGERPARERRSYSSDRKPRGSSN